MSFFIVGLPRSRTAWLSNFMTYDGLYCHHEALNGCRTLDQYREKIGQDGDSSTGLMLLDLNTLFPNRKILIIESDVKRAISFRRLCYGLEDNGEMSYIQSKLNALEGLRVGYNEINDRLGEIWEYLSDIPFDKKRGDLIMKQNIQTQNYNVNLDAMRDLLNDL